MKATLICSATILSGFLATATYGSTINYVSAETTTNQPANAAISFTNSDGSLIVEEQNVDVVISAGTSGGSSSTGSVVEELLAAQFSNLSQYKTTNGADSFGAAVSPGGGAIVITPEPGSMGLALVGLGLLLRRQLLKR